MSKKVLSRINAGQFAELFISELGWSQPRDLRAVNISSEVNDETYTLVPVAKYQGLSAWVCQSIPKRAVRTELSKILAKQASDFVLIFTDNEDQVWSWPSVNETRLNFRRLTAQHHHTGDKNDALARRVDRFAVDPQKSLSVADLLIAVKNGFDTDTEAALRIADLHTKLLSVKMDSTDIEIFLTRLLFLFFGEDTDLFARGPYDASVAFEGTVAGGDEFRNLLLKHPEGIGLEKVIRDLFVALRTPVAERGQLSPEVLDFPYVDGGLFHDEKPVPVFDQELRDLTLACSNLDWSDISPAIFGSMFEGLLESTITHVVNSDEGYEATRRQLGAHYTSEANILRVIEPLFLDDLRAELDQAADDVETLRAIHAKISSLTFFDPACGCGNFLVVTYKELREIENIILERLLSAKAITLREVPASMTVKIDQFFGIEISKSASAVAQVALWITDHQMNVETYEILGAVRHSIPLTETPGIVRGDALTYPWANVIRPADCDFIIGNPPYIGDSNQSSLQKTALLNVLKSATGTEAISRGGSLDYISGWFVKAVLFCRRGGPLGALELELFEESDAWGATDHDSSNLQERLTGVGDSSGTRIAFVSTNSICQGDQVPALWPWILSQGIHIQFAHRTFRWSNDNPGAANVFCVIVGLGLEDKSSRMLFSYKAPADKAPALRLVREISPYLTAGGRAIVRDTRRALGAPRQMVYGNKPTDNQNLLLEPEQRASLIAQHPEAAPYIRPLVGAREFLNGGERYCIWVTPEDLPLVENMPWASSRFEEVRRFRAASRDAATRSDAARPFRFQAVRHSDRPYLLVPRVSSEERRFVPIGYMPADVISTDANFMVPDATVADFSILTSSMHNAWMRTTSGRLKGDYRYSNTLTYNTFPWPDVDEAAKHKLEVAGQAVLDCRDGHPDMTLAQMYSPKTMPKDLSDLHAALDGAVDAIYGYKGSIDDSSRIEFLLPLYESILANKNGQLFT